MSLADQPHSSHPSGILFVVSAPSGAGKTSLVAALLENDPALSLSVSYTTRQRRPGEIDGSHYHFIDHDRFEKMIETGAFIEYARVFDNAYGTAEASLRETLEQGQDLLLEIDWQGARQVRERFPEAVSIFIVPPSLSALEQRLRGRGQDSDAVIRDRMGKARDELSHWDEYRYLVVNEHFDQALQELNCILTAERLRSVHQGLREQDRLRLMLGA
ncbi:guanylate kinase [Halochromatium roseum]|uniref:guanylate kinase n=1 Tax=Halochromatium roseum TaxID=391920 RepID=UPI00191364AF|nr:guanylate kinase [Halochromatium roseum]MBK5939019.1 guanylate kinase [Halochromatium roseum]